jgi:hypothetical protein
MTSLQLPRGQKVRKNWVTSFMNVPFVLFYANFAMFGHAFFGNEFIGS